jgi:hypothetical protein
MDATPEQTDFRPDRPLGSPTMAPDELASIHEIAQLLEVTERTAQRYAQRPDFPAPVDTIAGGRIRVWRSRDVERWAKRTLPLPRAGRPRKAK